MRAARIEKIVTSPASWNELSYGNSYRHALEQQLDLWWPKLFGLHLLKLGNLSAEIDTSKCQIAHHVNASESGNNIQVYADSLDLPFLDKSLDACLLADTLAYSEDPHRILREVDRVLVDDGWLIVSGFNPFSLVGVGKLIPLIRKKHPYTSRMFTRMRMIDWLSLLNYEVLYHVSFQNIPWNGPCGGFFSSHIPAFGCQTLIVARKRTIPLTLNPLSAFKKRFRVRSGAVGATKNMHNSD
ncbi:class I SAM-dependent methyltransferase [Budviciaceae bacterium BWR-B9]|uniref:Class I SAM-dependent methyltransferase n=1 Tax=Limnobaculum allomyrinae TaxID=2791986 RepID=A0ABS1IUL5_9GAMM|nr:MULTISPECIES: methyltransferase domain-containing protein [Limnobaculum]MBK5145454.1 class I SAM-dependent methyltransferase [Limnobaculum allomyrinae]MBV7693118.1 class I SAM-dependent methyltransferase [Limnobaculum sp. M2-1]